MNIDVMQYRAAIGIFNNLRIISRFRNLFDDLSAYSLRISVALLVSRIIITVLLPLIFFEFMLLNLILIFLCSYDIKIASLSNIKSFVNTIFLYLSLTVLFTFELTFTFLKNTYNVARCLLMWMIIIIDLSYIILLCGDIEIQPGLRARAPENLNFAF